MNRWYQLKDGQPVPVSPYTPNILQDAETRTVARDTFPDGSDEIVVSTIFLGLDHGWGDGPPVLWETMIFWTDNHELDDHQWRYTSVEAARKGHAEAVELVKQALQQPPAPTAGATGGE